MELCAGGFECAPGEVHPWHKPAMPSLRRFKESATYPVIVSPNPMATKQAIDGTCDPQYEVPINQGPITINSALIEGVMEVHVRGLPNSHKNIFEGKKRHLQIMVQGRFKRPVPASALCMGQEFVKPGKAPAWVGELVFTAAAKVFSNSTKVDAYGELPYFMNPVLAACQLVNVSQPGLAPPLAEAQEDMRLFHPALADKHNKPLSSSKRKKWCDMPKNLEGLMLGTEHIYTFHIWQHFIDFSQYKFSVPGLPGSLDLAGPLNGQPLQLTVYETQAKEHLFSMLVWHERLLYDDDPERHQAMQQLTERVTRAASGLKWLLGRCLTPPGLKLQHSWMAAAHCNKQQGSIPRKGPGSTAIWFCVCCQGVQHFLAAFQEKKKSQGCNQATMSPNTDTPRYRQSPRAKTFALQRHMTGLRADEGVQQGLSTKLCSVWCIHC